MSEVKLTIEGGDAFFPEFRDEFKLKETLEDNESFRSLVQVINYFWISL